jgi:hypothetical protein
VSRSIDEADPILWVNAGRVCLGRVYATGTDHMFEAVTDDGAALGMFASAEQAAQAIRTHASRNG